MKTWIRVEGDTICGLNAQHILKRGDAMQVIEVNGELYRVKRRFQRCERCADEPCPDDLPELPARS